MYAYTSSSLQYALLRLFVRCECILPNLFVGTITRESVTSAFACGLSADQIIEYLRQHASQHIAKRVPVVPEVRIIWSLLRTAVGDTGFHPASGNGMAVTMEFHECSYFSNWVSIQLRRR